MTATRTRTLLHAAALTYAKRYAIPVSRLAPRAKVPLAGTHGHLDATTKIDTIDDWWTKTPNANIAMPTGAVSGRVVIEIDPRNGGDDTLRDLEAEYGTLPETQRVLSGRGDGGYHMHFAHPGGYIKSGANLLGLGVDVKADGGQVVLPPSIHPTSGKPYQWDAGAHIDDVPLAELPGWVLAKLTEAKQRPATEPMSDDWIISEGSRNAGLTSIAGRLRRQGFNADEIGALLVVTNRQRCDPPLPDEDAAAIARSVCRYAPSEVPDFSEEAEGTARQENDRLRCVIGARHDFTAKTDLTATQKDVVRTIARFLPTLPTNDRGDVRVCAAYLKYPAGCSRGTVSTVQHILEKAGVWTLYPVVERRDDKIEKTIYARLADGIERTEASFLDAVTDAEIETKPRGGARTKRITLAPVLIDDLICPNHGDGGAVTHATTYCTAGTCGEIHRHDPVIHKAGWLADPAISTDGSRPPSVLMLKFEHQGGETADSDEPTAVATTPDAQSLTPKNVVTYVSAFVHQGQDAGAESLAALGQQLQDVDLDPAGSMVPFSGLCGECRAAVQPPARLCPRHQADRDEMFSRERAEAPPPSVCAICRQPRDLDRFNLCRDCNRPGRGA